jgi:hypothetical protein
MVSKCHNPKCSAEFRYFGDGKLFEFPPDSIRETPQLYWLCEHCVSTFTLQRDSEGSVKLISKADGHIVSGVERRRYHRAS